MYLSYYDDQGYDFETNGEGHVLKVLARFPHRVVFDVGANVGDWSKKALQAFPGAAVHAFELSQGTREVLRRNLHGTGVVIPAVGLSDAARSIEYKDYGPLSTVNTIVPTRYHDARTEFTLKRAELMPGDAYLAQHGLQHIDLLKIDVEGAELLVLQGFARALRDRRIAAIQFEYGYANGDAGHLMKAFYDLLGEHGYRIGRIWSAGVRFKDFEYPMNNFDSGPNYLAVAGDRADLIAALQSKG